MAQAIITAPEAETATPACAPNETHTRSPRSATEWKSAAVQSSPQKTALREGRNGSVQQALFVLLDMQSVWAGALIAFALRFPTVSFGGEHTLLGAHLAFVVLYSGVFALFANTQRLYAAASLPSVGDDALALVKSMAMASILLGACRCLFGGTVLSGFVIAATVASSVLPTLGWRTLRRRWLQGGYANGVTCHNVLIAGERDVAQAVAQHLNRRRELGFVVKGFLEGSARASKRAEGVLGSFHQLEEVVRSHFIDELIVCGLDRAAVRALVERAERCGVGVRIVSDLYDGLAFDAPTHHLGNIPSVQLHSPRIPAAALLGKRAIDLLVSGSALLVLSPLLLALAILVRLDSPGPVFYVSTRVGRKGRTFKCFKFRTMVSNAEQLKAKLQHLNERDGVLFKIANDPRVTRLGRRLRKYSLDEFAQLWNVFRGDMSLVGPRPPLASEVEKYQLDYLRRLEAAPGITGLWQVEARTNPSFDRYIELDLHYVREWSLSLDLKILWKTVGVVFAGTGQ